jgi:hypothetical protein
MRTISIKLEVIHGRAAATGIVFRGSRVRPFELGGEFYRVRFRKAPEFRAGSAGSSVVSD